jgi:hypothetical protein
MKRSVDPASSNLASPPTIHRHQRSRAVGRILILALLAFVFSSLFRMSRTVNAHADDASDSIDQPSDQSGSLQAIATPAPDACLDSLPIPTPAAGLHRVVQLVNCSNQVVLGTANAAQQKGGQPLPVLPREGTWVMQPFNPASPASGANVLTIDIPTQWENTVCPTGTKNCEGIVGPRLWARTGCSYNLAFDKAQCETGGCGGRYDCSAARLSASVGTTVSEWTLNQPVSNSPPPPPTNDWCAGDGPPPAPPIISYCKDSPDISAVDGVNLNMDIQPLGGSATDPYDIPNQSHDAQWLAQQYPLTKHGADLRATCPAGDFQLTRVDLTTGDPYGFVIVGSNGQPVGGNSTVACFSNCGRYAYPAPPDEHCDDTNHDSRCYRWKAFCLGDPSKYGKTLKCGPGDPYFNKCPVAGACWNLKAPASPLNDTCEGRGFVTDASTACTSTVAGAVQAACPNLTYPYGYIDPLLPSSVSWAYQPPYGLCSDVTGDPSACIGDDTLHNVMPKAYTWPNDPQVYGGNATAYRVIFAPGGNPTTAPITPASNSLPTCASLGTTSSLYDYTHNFTSCGVPIDYGAIFGVAHLGPFSEPKNRWACDLDPTGAGNEGVICTWKLPATAVIQQVGLKANYNSAGSSLQLNAIPGVQNGDLLLASITFLQSAIPTPPSGWVQVPGASVANENNQTVVWYHFVTTSPPEPPSYSWTWNSTAYPAGGMTAWRGVNPTTPFDTTALTALANSPSDTAVAPAITTPTPGDRLLSVFGAGAALGQNFEAPTGGSLPPTGPGDETIALRVNGGDAIGTYYAQLVADRIQTTTSALAQYSKVGTVPKNQRPGDWTAISMVLKPLNPYVPPAAIAGGLDISNVDP